MLWFNLVNPTLMRCNESLCSFIENESAYCDIKNKIGKAEQPTYLLLDQIEII